MKNIFKGKRVVIFGGAGSIGSALAKRLVSYKPHSVAIFDHNEYGIFKIRRELGDCGVRYFIGDVNDYNRVKMAMEKADFVFHLIALKHVDLAEYNPIEVIRTNTLGTINLIECALDKKPKKFIFVSSDKAVNFRSLYGSTKFQGEKLIIWANGIQRHTKFSAVRFGNVIESSGNIFEIWRDQLSKGQKITVTDRRMRRYFWHINDCVDFIIKSSVLAKGGEIFVPTDMEECVILSMAKSLSKNIKITKPKPGEKFREDLLTDDEARTATKKGPILIIEKK